LVDPGNEIQLADDTVVFRWRWLENKGCSQPPDGYGFEIRIWPDNTFAPPEGAMNAAAEKLNIHCDQNTGVRSFTLGNIKDAPAFKASKEGRFRWDVALVRLEPYEIVITTQHRTFFTN
jgi:hypothetical protein